MIKTIVCEGEQLPAVKTNHQSGNCKMSVLRGRISVGRFSTTNVIEHLEDCHTGKSDKYVQALSQRQRKVSTPKINFVLKTWFRQQREFKMCEEGSFVRVGVIQLWG